MNQVACMLPVTVQHTKANVQKSVTDCISWVVELRRRLEDLASKQMVTSVQVVMHQVTTGSAGNRNAYKQAVLCRQA